MPRKNAFQFFAISLLFFFYPYGAHTASSNSSSSDDLEIPELYKLPPSSPDSPTRYVLDKTFSLDSGLEGVQIVRGALQSFERLTEKSRRTVSKNELKQIGNTARDMQNIGFHNWPMAIEGTLRLQNLRIKKLQSELAKKRFENGEVSKYEADKKAADYAKTLADFKKFWKSVGFAD